MLLLANPAMYFNFFNSNWFNKVLLFPDPASTNTTPGFSPRLKHLSISFNAMSGFLTNSESSLPSANELTCWSNSTSLGRLFTRSYKCVVTNTTPLSVLPISPIYCLPTLAVSLPLFLCPESSIIKANPLLTFVWLHCCITWVFSLINFLKVPGRCC